MFYSADATHPDEVTTGPIEDQVDYDTSEACPDCGAGPGQLCWTPDRTPCNG